MALPWQITGLMGQPVLLMEPNGVDVQPDALAIRGTTITAPSGTRLIATAPSRPLARLELEFIAENPDQLAFVEGFFDGRLGRALPFWLPSTQWEFDVHGYALGVLSVRRNAYTADIFPLGTAYRQFVVIRGDRFSVRRGLSAAPSATPGFDEISTTDGGDHSTPEVVDLAGPLAARDDRYRVLWLRYVRFDQDELVAETIGRGSARVTLAMIEVPNEVNPAL